MDKKREREGEKEKDMLISPTSMEIGKDMCNIGM